MYRYLTAALLFASATYAAVAVGAFTMVFNPFAGLQQLPSAAFAILAVEAPYAVLLFAYRRARDRVSRIWVAAGVFVVAILGAYLYSGSFHYNDGEYGIAYVLTPIFQSPFALAPLAIAAARNRQCRAGA